VKRGPLFKSQAKPKR